MAFPTLAEIVRRTLLRLSQEPGLAVQTYSEPIVAEMVQHKFDVLFDHFWWDDYMIAYEATLGANGIVVDDMNADAGLMRFTDIQYAWYENDRDPLKRFSSRINPSQYTVTGRPIYIEPYAGVKVFRLRPFGTAGSSITINLRQYPGTLLPDDPIKIDAQALILGAAFDYLADDDSNPRATEKMRSMFNQRVTQLNNIRNQQEVEDPRARVNVHVPTNGWFTLS